MNETTESYWNATVDVATLASIESMDGHPLSIEIVNETSDFAALSTEWEDLVCQTPATIFQTFDWQFLWWKHFGSRPEHHLFVLIFRSQGRLVGIAPFFIQSTSFLHFTIFRRLKLLGSGLLSHPSPLLSLERQGPSDYLDIVAAPGYEAAVSKAFVTVLCSELYLWDEIELQNIPGKGLISTYVLPMIEPEGYSITKTEEDVCPMIALPKSLEEYFLSLRHSVRRNLRYVYRGYLENKEFQIEDIVAGGNARGGVQVLSQLHQKRWNAVGYPGLFSDARFGPFAEEVAQVLANKGRLWFKILRRDGKAIAANFVFRFKNRFYTYMSGFDRDSGSSSGNSGAGTSLVLLAVADAIKNGIDEIDLGRGTEPYKSQLTSLVNKNWRITIGSIEIRGRAFRILLSRTYFAWLRLVSRVLCEISIFTIVTGQKGALHALQGYCSHVWYRLASKNSDPFAQKTPPQASNQNTGSASSPSHAPVENTSKKQKHENKKFQIKD